MHVPIFKFILLKQNDSKNLITTSRTDKNIYVKYVSLFRHRKYLINSSMKDTDITSVFKIN
jgi:hypothetical protein